MEVPILKNEDLDPAWDPMGESLLTVGPGPMKAWLNPEYALVLGATQKPEVELQLAAVVADGIPVLRRRGGGGTVLLGPKGFCYGLRFHKCKDMGPTDYLKAGSSLLQTILEEEFGVSSAQRGHADLCIGDRKILGCSLYMPRDCVLYLASVLWDDESAGIAKYLQHPSREPDYRGGRRHEDFITCLQHEVRDCPSREWFCEALTLRAPELFGELLQAQRAS